MDADELVAKALEYFRVSVQRAMTVARFRSMIAELAGDAHAASTDTG
jgi:hypothetical protein